MDKIPLISHTFVIGGNYMNWETSLPGTDMKIVRRFAIFLSRFRFEKPMLLSKWLWDQTTFNWPIYISRTFIRRKDK